MDLQKNVENRKTRQHTYITKKFEIFKLIIFSKKKKRMNKGSHSTNASFQNFIIIFQKEFPILNSYHF